MTVVLESFKDAAALLRPGVTAFIHGTATEPREFVEWLTQQGALEGVHLITSFIPGINTETLADSGARLTTFMAQPALAEGIARGDVDALRLHYGELPGWIAALESLDVAFVRGRRLPDGRVATGITGELIAAACARADTVCVFDDPEMPLPEQGVTIEAPDVAVVAPGPLIEYRGGDRIDDLARTIAANVAPLVDDGATLQSGLGVVPTAVFTALLQRRNLRLFSGMISDAVMALADTGALDAEVEHVYGMALGTRALYEWLDGRARFRVVGCEDSHNSERMRALPQFTAINSAVEVGLDGSVNAELLGARAISGPGGLPDYAAGAAQSRGGKSIIALPAANEKRGISRIVPRVRNADAPTVSGEFVTHVVTQFGVAEIAGVGAAERARRLIAVADPAHRAALSREAALSH